MFNLPTNEKFGFFFGAVFVVAAIYFLLMQLSQWLIFFSFFFGLTFVGVAIFKPLSLGFLNFAWYKFGLILAGVISPIILAGLYFCVITPIGLVFKIFGRDELALKDRDVKSYWIMRSSRRNDLDSFRDQF